MRAITPASPSRLVRGTRVTTSAVGTSGFSVTDSGSAATPAPAGAPSLAGLLAAQEYLVETARDRAARRHGHAMLGLLAELQRGFLIDDPAVATLRRLADLAVRAPEPDDAVLAALLRDCRLRVAVELARHGL